MIRAQPGLHGKGQSEMCGKILNQKKEIKQKNIYCLMNHTQSTYHKQILKLNKNKYCNYAKQT